MNEKQIKKLLSLARTEIKKGKWDQASKLLEPLKLNGLDTLPAQAYSPCILVAAKTRSFQLGEEFLAAAPSSVRNDLDFLKAASELYFLQDKYLKALPYIETIHSEFEAKISERVAKIYALALKKLDATEAKKSKDRSTGESSRSADLAYKALGRLDLDDARQHFRNAVTRLTANTADADHWIAAFHEICDMHCQLDGTSADQWPRTTESQSPLRALSVSGMGWSGSGAIYDYFSEFTSVKKISGESPIIQSRSGISGLYSAKKMQSSVVNFFKLNLFGFCGTEGVDNQKNVRYAKSLMAGKRASEYAVVAHSIVSLLVNETRNSRFSLESLRQISDIYLRFRADIGDEASTILPMFDNIIHAYNLDAVRFASNMSLFCSVRDPRSNYVAMKRENLSFRSDVAGYVSTYRKKRNSIQEKYELFRLEKERDQSFLSEVHFVQFENFVLDTEYRRELARKAGLSLGTQNEYSCFKPWDSEKNVFLFEDYENQDEIRYIEKELPEYCVDLVAFDSMRTKS